MVTSLLRSLFVVSLVLLASVPARGSSKSGPKAPLAEREPPPSELVFPPLNDEGPAPVTVYLHGMCGAPENACGHFARVANRRGWLVCPRAPNPCENGGTRWTGGHDGALVEAAVERLRLRYPDRVIGDDRTLIGFSQGAFVAADILQQRNQPYRYALFIGAKAPLQTSLVLGNGVVRVLLSAGDRDGASPFMQRAARRLWRGGVDARFDSMGDVGHSFAADRDTWLDGALAWLWAPKRAV